MKAIIEGVKRAKARSILSALIALVAAAAICICMGMSPGTIAGRGNPPEQNGSQDTSETQTQAEVFGGQSPFDSQSDTQTATLQISTSNTSKATSGDNVTSDDDTASDDEAASDDETASDNNQNGDAPQLGAGEMKQPSQGGFFGRNTMLTAVLITVAAILLLVIINAVSTKKRTGEFLQMLQRGVPLKAVRKQLFIEAFVIVLIFGIIGTAGGAALARPVSSLVMSSISENTENMPQNSDGEQAFELDENAENGSMPQPPSQGDGQADADDDNSGEAFSEPAQMPEGDFPGDTSSDESGNGGDTNNAFGNRGGASSVITSIGVSVAAVILMAASAGVACMIPIKKQESIEAEKTEDDNE